MKLESYIAPISKYEIKTMSFAVIQTGGKQYKVSTSEILKIERLNNQEGKTVEFKNVLFLNDDKTNEIGNPNIQGAKVEATILKNTKNKTILVFKKRRRKNSRKKYGHRQEISLVRITKIFSKNGKLISEAGPRKTLVQTEKARDEFVRKRKAEKTRILQESEAKNLQHQEKKRIKIAVEKTKLITKKSDIVKKKIVVKKKPLTTKKK